MLNYDFVQCAVVILVLFVIGEIISTKTKAFVPSIFVTAVLFLLGFWSGLIPTDIVDTSGFSAIGVLAMLAIVVHMGTMLSPGELIDNWKTVVIALFSLAGLTMMLLVIGSRIFDWNTVIVSIPPLAGGMTAALIMQSGAAAKGLTTLSVLAVLVTCLQGFVGYPLTAVMLKREAKRLMLSYNGAGSGDAAVSVKSPSVSGEACRRRVIPAVPKKYRTIYFTLLVSFFTVWLAIRCEMLTGGKVSRYVFCLVLGVILCQLGFLEKNCLNETLSYGFFQTAAMSMVFAGLSAATPEMIAIIIGPLAGIIIIGVAGLFIFSAAAGRILKYSWEMSFSVALNALYGFPANMILTNEIINSISDDQDVKDYLTEHMMSKMLVGGFTSVTVTSTLLAGVFINMLH